MAYWQYVHKNTNISVHIKWPVKTLLHITNSWRVHSNMCVSWNLTCEHISLEAHVGAYVSLLFTGLTWLTSLAACSNHILHKITYPDWFYNSKNTSTKHIHSPWLNRLQDWTSKTPLCIYRTNLMLRSMFQRAFLLTEPRMYSECTGTLISFHADRCRERNRGVTFVNELSFLNGSLKWMMRTDLHLLAILFHRLHAPSFPHS